MPLADPQFDEEELDVDFPLCALPSLRVALLVNSKPSHLFLTKILTQVQKSKKTLWSLLTT